MKPIKKKKNYQKAVLDSKRSETLKMTFQGFLVSCAERNKEQRAIKEVKSLLSSHISNALSQDEKKQEEPVLDKRKKVDFQEELKMEVLDLKKSKDQYLEMMATNVPCLIIFRLKSEKINPSAIISSIFDQALKMRVSPLRFCSRILPLACVCKATQQDFLHSGETVLKKWLESQSDPFTVSMAKFKWCVQFKNRNNDNIKRKVVLQFVKMMIEKHSLEGSSVSLKESQFSIIVQIIRDICCISVLKDYRKYHKYNLQMTVRELIESQCKEPNQLVIQDLNQQNIKIQEEQKQVQREEQNEVKKQSGSESEDYEVALI